MPNSWDMQPVKITNDPTQRMNYEPGKFKLPSPIDVLEQWAEAFGDFIGPVIQNITGLDFFHGPAEFVVSLIEVLTTGGPAVQFALSLLDMISGALGIGPIGDVLPNMVRALSGINLSTPGAVVAEIVSTATEVASNIVQPIIDAIHQALTGASEIGNDVTAVIQALFNPLKLFNNALALIQSIFGDLGGHAGGLDARISALEAQALGAAGLVSGDNFNRATIGSTWTNVVGTLLISSGDYVKTSSRAAAYYNAGGPSTDRHGVAVKLVDRSAGDCQFWMCGDTGMTNFVGVEVHAGIFGDDYIQLFTGSSPTVGVAQAQESFVSNLFGQNSLRSGDVIALNYDEITNTYTVTRNSKVIEDLTWTDTTNIVTHGPTKRNTGVVTNSLNQHQFPGFGITDFVYYDRSTT